MVLAHSVLSPPNTHAEDWDAHMQGDLKGPWAGAPLLCWSPPKYCLAFFVPFPRMSPWDSGAQSPVGCVVSWVSLSVTSVNVTVLAAVDLCSPEGQG